MTSSFPFYPASHKIPGNLWRRRFYFTLTTFCCDNEKWQHFDLEILSMEGQAAADTASATALLVFSTGEFFGVIYHVIKWNISLPIYNVGDCGLKVAWNSLWEGEKGQEFKAESHCWKLQHCGRGWPGSKAGVWFKIRRVMNIPNPLHKNAGREWGVLFPGGTIPSCGSQLDCRQLREQGEEQETGREMGKWMCSLQRGTEML